MGVESGVNRVEHLESTTRRELGNGVTEFALPPAERSPLSLSVLRLGMASSVTIGSESADSLLFVFEGSGAMVETGRSQSIAVGTATLVPAGTFADFEANAGGLALVCAQAGPDCDRHASLGEPVHIVEVEEAERDAATGSRTFQILFGPHNGSTLATLFVGYVPPGRAPWHFHQYDEIVWVWRGFGQYHLAQGAEEVHHGSAFRIRPREVHVVENVGDDELVLLGLFTPAGNPSAAYLADI